MLRRFWLLLLILVFTPVAGAEGLQLQPHICVVDSDGVCQVNLQLSYSTDTPQAVCFIISSQSERWCKEVASEHLLSVQLITSTAVTVQVIEQQSGSVLASGTLMLAEFIPSNSRKRRRFSWSFQ